MSRKPGKPAVASWRPDRLDVFVRGRGGSLVHSWVDGSSAATVDLGGSLASDPVAVVPRPGSLQVFARGTDQSLLTWSWDPSLRRMGALADWGSLATDPVPVCWRSDPTPAGVVLGHRLVDVLARSVDGPLLGWSQVRGGPFGFLALRLDVAGRDATSDPAVVSDGLGRLDVFVRGADHQLEQWRPDGSTLRPSADLGGRLISKPIAVSWARDRLDVYARTDDGRLTHWGFDGRLTGLWFGPEPAPGITDPLAGDPVVVSRRENELDLFARTVDGALKTWTWDAAERRWSAPFTLAHGVGSDPVAVWRNPDRLEVFVRTAEGRLLNRTWLAAGSPLGDPDGLGGWQESFWDVEDAQPSPAPPTEPHAARPPDRLVTRPKDHVVLGVHWSGCELVDTAPPSIEPVAPGAQVVLTFPPQHVAEEVAAADTTNEGVRQARLAGLSQVAFAVDERIALTAQGLLGALDGATVLSGTGDPAEGGTTIELPYGLFISPVGADGGGEGGGNGDGVVRARHASTPAELNSGAVGLWRTRLATGTPTTGLRMLGAGRPDPFPLPLPLASRRAIAAQSSPAQADRLELGSLGGSLAATGRWPGLEWDHVAVLGRDHFVRTLEKGVLYPLGHRAEYLELTERVADPAAADPVAELRKRRVLYVTEPVRAEPTGDGSLARAFPFAEVEIGATVHADLDHPVHLQPPHVRPTLKIAQFEAHRDQVVAVMQRLRERVHGEMGWNGGPVMETLAATVPDAAEFLGQHATLVALLADIEALKELGGQPVDVGFWPTRGGEPIRFPVRLAAGNGDVHVEVPLLFVQDLQLDGDLWEPFFSLTDPAVATALAKAYAARGAGVVELPDTPIALVRPNPSVAPGGPAADLAGHRAAVERGVHIVRRLNLVPVPHGGGFRTRLGEAVRNVTDTGTLDPKAWGVQVKLPAVQSLLGPGSPAAAAAEQVSLAFAQDYELGDATEVALRLAAKDPLGMSFTEAADRAGGLVAPVIPVTAISQVDGLVNLAGSQDLDPMKLLGAGATLLGFDLRSLLGTLGTPPQIVTDVLDGKPPVVEMSWKDVALKPFPAVSPVFRPAAGSTMTMRVRAGARLPVAPPVADPSDVPAPTLTNETTCVVGPFALHLPPAGPLLELSFTALTFTQAGSTPPTLAISGLDAKFVGKLHLLQVLQKSVGLGSAGPGIDLTPRGITARYALPVPSVAVMAFSLSNLVLHARLDVPFTGDPVAIGLGFGRRDQPFTVGVLMFGGGGYVDVELIHSGVRRLEIALEFGASVAIGIGVATVEVHAMGGIRYAQSGGSVVLTGYLRIGGSVELFGLVSVSVELRVELNYQEAGNRLVGRARLVIEVDLTLYSDSIEIDSGDWVIAGGTDQRMGLAAPLAAPTGLDEWSRYRRAFSS